MILVEMAMNWVPTVVIFMRQAVGVNSDIFGRSCSLLVGNEGPRTVSDDSPIIPRKCLEIGQYFSTMNRFHDDREPLPAHCAT